MNRRILTGLMTVGSLTLFANLVAAGRDVLVAHHFGVSDQVDAFLVANIVPMVSATVIGGAIHVALIPTYLEVLTSQGARAAQELLSSVVIASLALLTGLAILLAILAPWLLPLLGSGFGAAKMHLTRSMFLMLLPTLVLRGLAQIWSGVLQSSEQFTVVSLSPVISPLIVVAALLGLTREWGIYSYALGMIGGAILEAVVLGVALRRTGVRLDIRWSGLNAAARQVAGQILPIATGSILMSLSGLVDQSMAAMLGSGRVSALGYASKIVSFALGSSATALGTVMLPYFSRMVVSRDWPGLRRTLRSYSIYIFLGSSVLTLLLVIFSEPLVRFVFQRGSFTAADTHSVSAVQRLLVLQVPFYIVGMLYVRLISAFNANSLIMRGTIISVVLNISLNYLFMKYWGLTGIALSTSVVFLVSSVYLGTMAHRILRVRSGCE